MKVAVVVEEAAVAVVAVAGAGEVNFDEPDTKDFGS